MYILKSTSATSRGRHTPLEQFVPWYTLIKRLVGNLYCYFSNWFSCFNSKSSRIQINVFILTYLLTKHSLWERTYIVLMCFCLVLCTYLFFKCVLGLLECTQCLSYIVLPLRAVSDIFTKLLLAFSLVASGRVIN